MKLKLERYVDIIINLETGDVTSEAFNFVGKQCDELDFLYDALGGVATSTHYKTEYYKNTPKVVLKEKVKLCG